MKHAMTPNQAETDAGWILLGLDDDDYAYFGKYLSCDPFVCTGDWDHLSRTGRRNLHRDGDPRVSGGAIDPGVETWLWQSGRIEKSDWKRGELKKLALPPHLAADCLRRAEGQTFLRLTADVDELRVGDVIVEVGGVRPADSAAVLAGRGQQAAVWRPPRGWSPP